MGYEISDDRGRLDLEVVYRYLSQEAYWARGRPRDVFERSVAGSLCLGAYEPGGTMAGFARVVTDGATFGWLCDLFVLPEHRGRGVAGMLVRAVHSHPAMATVSRIMLATADAHELYRRHGYEAVDEGRYLEVRRSAPPERTR